MIELIIDIADYLRVPVVAEGVETGEQLTALKALGCDYVQGYYFSKPVPAGEYERFLVERGRDSAEISPEVRTRFMGADGFLNSGCERIYYVDTRTDCYLEFYRGSRGVLEIRPGGTDFFRDLIPGSQPHVQAGVHETCGKNCNTPFPNGSDCTERRFTLYFAGEIQINMVFLIDTISLRGFVSADDNLPFRRKTQKRGAGRSVAACVPDRKPKPVDPRRRRMFYHIGRVEKVLGHFRAVLNHSHGCQIRNTFPLQLEPEGFVNLIPVFFIVIAGISDSAGLDDQTAAGFHIFQ
jgi:hypothetical protein